MTYASWEPRYRVTTVAPGKLDLFVVTLVNGRRGALQPIMEYEEALVKARAFLAGHLCQIKVLPMTGLEVRNLLSLKPADAASPTDTADREMVVSHLMQITRESSDGDARADAFDLLKQMGVIQQ